MIYDISAFVKDFASRTQKNLEVIEKLSKDRKNNTELQVYEVTQLINSLLGLLIIPQQAFAAAGKAGYTFNKYSIYDNGELKDLIKSLQERRCLYPQDEFISEKDFIRRLRNAVAHPDKGIQFYPISKYQLDRTNRSYRNNEKNTITHIFFLDCGDSKKGEDDFCVRLSLREVRKVALSISDSISQMFADTPYEEIKRREKLLDEMQELVPGSEE